MKTFMLFALVGFAAAACPNGCSGNGVCGANDKCSCFQNWQGPDCSGRTCPYALAWADTADGTNSAHYYAECSNKGVCDRKTGECKCFDGYEGKGCRRSTCPEGCSGHGTCEYIDELAGDFYDRRTGPGARYSATHGTKQGSTSTTAVPLSNTVADTDNTRMYHGFLYQLWDAQKIQGCKCDLGYSGPDCASRVAPRGDDPLTTVKSQMGKQAIKVLGAASGAFSLIYHDPYGGVWRTDGIASRAGTDADDTLVAKAVQDALRALPNEVLEGVTVGRRTASATVCHRYTDGAQHIPSANGHGATNKCESTGTITKADTDMDFDVTFNDRPGQTGVQFLLEVDTAARGAGCFPVIAGISSGTHSVGEIIGSSDSDLGALSELAECSDRGLDNGDGECECFDGFRGLACEEQEALV